MPSTDYYPYGTASITGTRDHPNRYELVTGAGKVLERCDPDLQDWPGVRDSSVSIRSPGQGNSPPRMAERVVTSRYLREAGGPCR